MAIVNSYVSLSEGIWYLCFYGLTHTDQRALHKIGGRCNSTSQRCTTARASCFPSSLASARLDSLGAVAVKEIGMLSYDFSIF